MIEHALTQQSNLLRCEMKGVVCCVHCVHGATSMMFVTPDAIGNNEEKDQHETQTHFSSLMTLSCSLLPPSPPRGRDINVCVYVVALV